MPSAAGVPSTRRKLEEARYYYETMKAGTRRMTQQHPREWEIFGFHLSAFLGAAASVTDVLQAENKQLCARVCQAFEDRLASEDLALLGWLYDLRVDEVHVTGAEVQRETGTIPITEAIRPQTYFPGWLIVLGSPEAPEVARIGIVPRAEDPRGRIMDVIPACQRCLELLEALVVDAEQDGATPALPVATLSSSS